MKKVRNEMERGQFTFYRSFWEAMKALPKKDQLPFVTAVCGYAFGEDTGPLTGAANATFLLVKPVLEKASKKSASGKIGGGKTEAKPKQNRIKEEANTKQTRREKEGEKERDEEREKEKEKEDECPPPLPPSGGTAKQEDSGFGPELDAAFSGWLQYKREKRQDYKPTGLGTLAAKVRKYAEAYGEHAVAELIRDSMSSNYQGILWDRLGKGTGKGIRPTPGDNSWMRAYIQERKEEG